MTMHLLESWYDGLADRGPAFVSAALILGVFWLLANVARGIIARVGNRFESSRRDVLNLAAETAKVTLIILGLLTALGTLGVNITALVASLGLTGFALGFALKDAVSSLLAGVLILYYQPFRRGDRIAVAGFEGEVVEIDLRYTRIQARDRVVLVPNSNMFTNAISILSKQDQEEEPV